MFKNALVRKPSSTLAHGLTTAHLGKPEFGKAVEQHRAYIRALRQCGLVVQVLDADDNFPDSVFIEDVALCTPRELAVVTRPGAPSRRGEVAGIRSVLENYFEMVEEIHPPGRLEAGDVMMVGTHFYFGLSKRTNKEGARQLIHLLERYGMSGSMVPLKEMLHLKTGVSYLENNNLLVAGEFIHHPAFEPFNKIVVDAEEAYAANSVWINGKVLIPAGNPKTCTNIQSFGYEVLELDMSEFRKLDGGLSCLSLRF